MSSFSKFRKRYDELIVLKDYTFAGGSARPIYNYYRHQLLNSNKKMALLRLVYRHSYLKLIYYTFLSDEIIINGIACFAYWPVLLLCYFKKNVVIYLHEAAPHTEPIAQKYPVKFQLFCKLLTKRKIAFVSEWQRQYFLKFAPIPRYRIIYNNINFPYSGMAEGKSVVIAMIGYQSKIKNVSFFSNVADAATKLGLPYEFIWIGGIGGEMTGMYHSTNVRWLGDQEYIMDSLNDIDVLLFTSYSDTFGLVLAEALYKGKKIVSYFENGLAPFIAKLSGCRIYDRFDEELVLRLINQVLEEPVELNEHKALATYLCSMENFEKRMAEIFEM